MMLSWLFKGLGWVWEYQKPPKFRWASAQGMSDHSICALANAIDRKNWYGIQLNQHIRAQVMISSNIVCNFCLNCCFFSEKCTREGRGRYTLMFTWVGTFLYLFCGSLSQPKSRFRDEIVVQMEPEGDFLSELFLENISKSNSAFRLHRRARIACEEPLWNTQGGSKLRPTHTHTHRIQEPLF